MTTCTDCGRELPNALDVYGDAGAPLCYECWDDGAWPGRERLPDVTAEDEALLLWRGGAS